MLLDSFRYRYGAGLLPPDTTIMRELSLRISSVDRSYYREQNPESSLQNLDRIRDGEEEIKGIARTEKDGNL